MDHKEKNSDYLYKVERVCGNGSFGIVFQAKVIHTGEIVAIKKVYQDIEKTGDKQINKVKLMTTRFIRMKKMVYFRYKEAPFCTIL